MTSGFYFSLAAPSQCCPLKSSCPSNDPLPPCGGLTLYATRNRANASRLRSEILNRSFSAALVRKAPEAVGDLHR